MKEKKDIYWQGRIYHGIDTDADGYAVKYLPMMNYSRFEVISPHGFTDGQEVVFRKDYSLQCQWYTHVADRWDNCTDDQYDAVAQESVRRIIALPLPPSHQVEEKSISEFTSQLMANQFKPQVEDEAKEKAKELVGKFYSELLTDGSNNEKRICWGYAKQCAIICVDEIENALDKNGGGWDGKFWQSVKNHIQQL